jgi:hypothetical protein
MQCTKHDQAAMFRLTPHPRERRAIPPKPSVVQCTVLGFEHTIALEECY